VGLLELRLCSRPKLIKEEFKVDGDIEWECAIFSIHNSRYIRPELVTARKSRRMRGSPNNAFLSRRQYGNRAIHSHIVFFCELICGL